VIQSLSQINESAAQSAMVEEVTLDPAPWSESKSRPYLLRGLE
jgi:hypothetical protein